MLLLECCSQQSAVTPGDNTDQNGGRIRFWGPNLGLKPKYDQVAF